MKALYWTIYIFSMFGLGCLIAHVTRKPPKKPTHQAADTMHLDLDFTQFESKK